MPPYRRDELPEGRTDWARVQSMTDEEKRAIAKSDPDNPPWTREALAEAELVLPSGKTKTPLSVRFDSEMVASFKAGGAGYQTRMNDVLVAFDKGLLWGPFDAAVVEFFRAQAEAQGKDPLQRMNEALRAEMRREQALSNNPTGWRSRPAAQTRERFRRKGEHAPARWVRNPTGRILREAY